MDGMKIVGYRVDGEKYCEKCFDEKFGDQTLRFSPVYLAVQIQSEIKDCCVCKEKLIKKE